MVMERIANETSLFDHTGYCSAPFGLHGKNHSHANPRSESHTRSFIDSFNANNRPNPG